MKKKLFEVAVYCDGEQADFLSPAIVVEPQWVLAKDAKAAEMMAVRMIDGDDGRGHEWAKYIDALTVVVRPFEVEPNPCATIPYYPYYNGGYLVYTTGTMPITYSANTTGSLVLSERYDVDIVGTIGSA